MILLRCLRSSNRSIMYRASSSSGIKLLKGRLGDRLASSSAVANKSSSSGGIFGWFAGKQSIPHLDTPLPGVSLLPPLPDYVEAGQTKITTLPNGVRIASETSRNPVASVGLYVNCGSVYETSISSGSSYLLERMAFKSTTNRSHFRIVREVEAIGGNVTASASREQIGYSYDALKTYVPEMVELLIDCVRNPVFLDWELNEELKKVEAGLSEINKDPQRLLLDAIHSVGYSGALANPLSASESAISRLNSKILEEFVAENYTGRRIVLSASGVEHEELLSIANPLLSDLPDVPHTVQPKSQYIGGEFRRPANSPTAHIALAFESPGGWHKEKDAMTLTVLQVLMGGGGSLSTGGPGKGMHSRLYVRALNEFPEMQLFYAFNSIYNETGLFGIIAATGSESAPKAIDLAARELLDVATPGKVSQAELDRAKNTVKSSVLSNLESRTFATQDIGRQILTYGHRKEGLFGVAGKGLITTVSLPRKPAQDFLKAVDDITLKDISSIAQKIVSTPLTMASWGNVANVPSYESVSSKFHVK